MLKDKSIGFILGWIFGVIYLICGLSIIISYPLAGIMMLLLAVVLIPPVINTLESLFKIKFTKFEKTLMVIALFLCLGIASYAKHTEEKENIRIQQEKMDAVRLEVSKRQLEEEKRRKAEEERERVEKEIENSRRRLEREREKAEELQKASKDLSIFKTKVLNALASQNINIVQDIYLNKDLPQEVIIVMKPIWHVRNKHLRKNDAKIFWELWASIYSPTNPDIARVKLISLNNDHVGGSRIWAGSLIWVED